MIEEWTGDLRALDLAENEVHVWCVQTERQEDTRAWLRSLLSQAERGRADRFYFRKDAELYEISHGVLRVLLGAYAGSDPEALEFEVGPFGKPRLAALQNALDIRFSLAHTLGMAVIGFARHREVGVDVERLDRAVDVDTLAQTVFSAREIAELEAAPDSQRLRTFFCGWTRKEAVLKATGQGLVDPLQGVEVSLHPDKAPELLAFVGEHGAVAGQWTLWHIEPGAGFVAALAIASRDIRVVCRSLGPVQGRARGASSCGTE